MRHQGIKAAMRPGAVLLECVLALALFVACGLAVMGMMDRAMSSVAATRDAEQAVDVARTAMAQIEAGIAMPDSLNGEAAPWRDESAGFNDALLSERVVWMLEVRAEASSFDGLTNISVRAVKQGRGSDAEIASYTLHQLVRLGKAQTRRGGG